MNPPRKVLIVNTADHGGGAERFCWLLFKGLEARGVETWLLVGDKKSEDPHVMPLYASPHLDYRPYASWRFRLRNRILRRLDRRLGLEDFRYPFSTRLLDLTGSRPDLVLCCNLHGGYFDVRELAPLSHRVPLVLRPADAWLFTGHCACPLECERWLRGCGRCPDLARFPSLERDNTSFNWWRKRRIYQRSRFHVVTASRWQMERLHHSMLAPALRAGRVIPNGVDQAVFRSGSRAGARQALDLPRTSPIALVVSQFGRENPYKGFDTLEAALERLAQAPAARGMLLLVVGGHETRAEQRGTIRIQHLPYCASPPSLALHYQAADFLVHPALEESFGNAIAEALSCGLPVLASQIGAIPELVRHGETGLLVPPRQPKAFAEALRELLDNPNRREEMGRRGATRTRTQFGLDTMIERYLDYFTEVCALTAARTSKASTEEGVR